MPEKITIKKTIGNLTRTEPMELVDPKRFPECCWNCGDFAIKGEAKGLPSKCVGLYSKFNNMEVPPVGHCDHWKLMAGINVGKWEIQKVVTLSKKSSYIHFHLKAANGEIILQGETYARKAGAMNGIDSIKRNALLAPVVVLADIVG